MMDPEEMERLGEGAEEEYAELELGLLIAIALALGRLETFSPVEINAVANELRVETYRMMEEAIPGIREAVRADVEAAMVKNGVTEVEGTKAAPYAARIAQSAKVEAEATFRQIASALTVGNQEMYSDAQLKYYQAAQRAAARVRAGLADSPAAVRDEVSALAEEGITFSTYTRSDGTVVHTPVDVGVRREIVTHATQAMEEQVLDIAEMIGANLVEVSSHPGARPSHAKWHGRIYMLNGARAQYPNFYERTMAVDGPYADMVKGYGGYNCLHTMRIYHEGQAQRWSPNPEAGSGYTNDEIYEARQRQRAIENKVRKDKRAVETLEGAGMDATKEKDRLRRDRESLREQIASNPFLRRERWREQI